MSFQKDFLWGAAAASYQVEGAYQEDGKGLNIWDVYTREPGHVAFNENGDVACDHYHRFKEDVALMKQIGLKAYRLSISWTRVIPNGTGEVNPAGIAFYNALIDELLAAGIEPLVTIFHWDYPYALHCRGGWLNPASSDWFEAYTRVLVDSFSDRVRYWMTINEPQVFITDGYKNGNFAPFMKHPDGDLIRMTHNVLLAHGKAVRTIRAHAKRTPIVGFAPTGPCVVPASNAPEDIERARAASFDFNRNNYTSSNAWWGDPIVLGHYSPRAYELFGDLMPKENPEEMALISQKLDFYGANIYWSMQGGELGTTLTGCPKSNLAWPLTPDVMYWSIRFLHERYQLPLMITENGMAGHDWVALDGKVHDPDRIDYLTRYLRSCKRAVEEGLPLIGYMHWSIMDNFEWARGYDQRFGLIHVDYGTQKRTLKDSAYWYASVIAENGENL
ncbi:GH1 family beta-glucosidase [Ruminococcus champanellensis]|uniref:Beta-glucosidase n=1 Tax=Ruminococcus champanellensis (strain DSM 18848 / JCM 17042 / KCTC 15320 / 18P13) TaxID=213810 RepID=D4LC32_RUMC1|nr:GH1 family beta-glucosidase [Ruminococcus champanellensis]CBL17177.1 beta-galactosidase [Ruminococcus champanellensis 18P13 = JCM 17042]